ncbi:MAG: hypothetical protein ACFCUU_14135 [Cyclobacteriaceae bacterium]
MIFPKAKKIAREFGWYKTKDGVFGLYKGYFFNVSDASLLSNPQFKFVTATTDNLTEDQKFEIKSELEANKKILKFTNFEIEDNRVFIQFAESFTYTKIKTIYALFDFLVELFKKISIPEQNKCHSCGTIKNLKYYDLNNSGIILCNDCFREIEKNFYEIEREKFSEEKNYLTGFLGSIAFSIPGIIVWVLVAVYFGRLVSAMAMVIAFLGIKGYEFFKGRYAKLTKYLIVLSNIISIVLANVATIIAMLLNEGLTLREAFAELQVNEVAKDLLIENTIVSFVLAFFIWIWLLFILKEQKLKIILANKL